MNPNRSPGRVLRPLAFGLLLACLSGAFPGEAMGQQDAPPPPVTARVLLSGDASALLVIHYRDPAEAPDTLRAQAVEERGDEGVVRSEVGGVELHFARREMEEIVPILRIARVEVESLPVTIRILEELRAGDVWQFQARLSQAGIRQVRIVSDPPP